MTFHEAFMEASMTFHDLMEACMTFHDLMEASMTFHDLMEASMTFHEPRSPHGSRLGMAVLRFGVLAQSQTPCDKPAGLPTLTTARSRLPSLLQR